MKELVYTSKGMMGSISAPAGCDLKLASALAELAGEITPSHSITSRRFSIWSLVRKHADRPFLDAIAPLRVRSWSALIGQFLPSKAYAPPSLQVVQIATKFKEVALTRINEPLDVASRAESAVAAMLQWDECLRLAGRKLRSDEQFSHLLPTLDAMRSLLATLAKLRPRVERDKYGISVRDKLTRPDQFAFCELCWRESLRTHALREGSNRIRAMRLTNRFCNYHDPRDCRSKYRVDIRYKVAFHRELDALSKIGHSAFSFRFHAPRGADLQELRKTAYDLVHARLRPLDSIDPGLREKVAALLSNGLTQAEVARQLQVSRQAVSQAKKSLQKIIKARQLDAEISPRTGESLALSGASGHEVRALIAQMTREGRSPSEIGRTVHRFGHSILFLVE